MNIFKFIDAFLSEHVDTALIQFDAILNLGFDPEILLEGLAGHLRNLMIIKDPKMQDLFEGSALHKKNMQIKPMHAVFLCL